MSKRWRKPKATPRTGFEDFTIDFGVDFGEAKPISGVSYSVVGTTAEFERGVGTIVDLAKWHPGVAKAWVKFK